LCKVCKAIGRSCTYNRPERKRGPSQGVRQRLEGQVESLESILGYLVDTYPQLCRDVINNLRLEDAEGAILKSLPSSSSMSGSSPPSSSIISLLNIYPQYNKQDARNRWKASAFAKAVAPSLGLILTGEDEEDEAYGMDTTRNRIEEARMARARLRSGISNSSPTLSSTSQQQHSHRPPTPLHYPTQVPSTAIPIIQAPYHSQMAPQYPHYPTQNQYTKERSYPSQQSTSSNPSYSTGFTPEQAVHHPLSYHTQPSYSRPPDNYPATASIVSPIEPYASYPTPTLEGETDALAYALGLTYSSSPQSSQSIGRRMGPPFSTSAWMGPPGSFSDSQGDMMRSIDEHMQSSSGAADDMDEQYATALDFFADHDLQPDQHQLSVLHQLGLQGSNDMLTPKPTDSTERGRFTSSSSMHDDLATSSSSTSNNHHNNPNHWLQPIRGIN
jgi:hypothetical protein